MILFSSCVTTNLEKMKTEAKTDPTQEEQKLLKIEQSKEVVYVDRPIFVPRETPPKQVEKVTGKELANKSIAEGTYIPQEFENGLVIYPYEETKIFPVYAKTETLTDITLEPGETVLEKPFLSETKKWEVGGGVAKVNGLDTQHIFLKPWVAGLETTLIIITDRRTYHINLTSYSNTYMAMVKWNYFNSLPQNFGASVAALTSVQSGTPKNGIIKKEESSNFAFVDPRLLSDNYKVSYNVFSFWFKKPVWLPEKVYDDGEKTYIVFPLKTLQMTMPAVFAKNGEIVNTRQAENMVIIDKLIDSVVVKYNGKKITITKKRG